MNIKIGPAGLGSVKLAENMLEEYKRKGFGACEIAFTYSVYIKNKEDAIRIGKKAKELGISLSIHAPYWVNFNSKDKAKREATKKRIMDCCEIGELAQVDIVVFHPGYYGKNTKEEGYNNIRDGILDVMKEIKKKGWEIKIGAETMGRVNVFGSLEETRRLVDDTGCSFCIDFAHVLAREKHVDYEKIKKMFPEKKWHVHFSGIVYGEKGEKHHRMTEKAEWKKLLENLPKDKEIVIINESPTMIDDCVEGLKILRNI